MIKTYQQSLPVSESEREVSLCQERHRDDAVCLYCHGSGKFTICSECGNRYVLHNAWTPIYCTNCDPEAWLNPPMPAGRKSMMDSEES